MRLAFRETVAAALPSEERLHVRLAALSPQEWEELALLFAATLPEFDAVLVLPGAAELAGALAQARGVPVWDALPGSGGAMGTGPGEVVLVSGQLTDGLPELEALLRAERRGLHVLTALAAIERTNAPGRTRLELHEVPVRAAVQLADTPGGLTFERRTAKRWPRAS